MRDDTIAPWLGYYFWPRVLYNTLLKVALLLLHVWMGTEVGVQRSRDESNAGSL